MVERLVNLNIEHGEKPEPVVKLWQLGDDRLSQGIADSLGFLFQEEDLEFVMKAAGREKNSLNNISGISGRTATAVVNNAPEIFGKSYDALEIGGFGFREPLSVFPGEGMMVVDYSKPVEMPSGENFSHKYPEITTTRVFDKTGFITLHDVFRFSGAYTLNEAAAKVAANLQILSNLAGYDNPPFLVPVPIMIGAYPQILDPHGNPAYFIAWRVPYEGKRTGILPVLNSPDDFNKFIFSLLKPVPYVAKAVRFLHDNLRLTHNQLTPQNYFVDDDQSVYLADFGTIYPFSKRYPYLSRFNDLERLLYASLKYLKNLEMPAEKKRAFMQDLYIYTLKYYLSIDRDIFLRIPDNEEKVESSLFQDVFKYWLDGSMPDRYPPVSNWTSISNIKAELLHRLKVPNV